MDFRHLVAFGLILLLVAAAFAGGIYLRHHSRDRTMRRDRARSHAWRQARSESEDR